MATEHESPDPENAASTRPGVQGWLFDRPPQTPECEAMKPPRRLGKGLAALVDLHTGSESTPATDGQNDEIGSSVLNLLSTTAEELEDSKRAIAAAAVSAPPVPPAAQAAPQPVAAEPEAIVAVQGGDESERDVPSGEEDDYFSASEDDTSPVDVPVEEPEAPTGEPVVRPPEEDAPEAIAPAALARQPEPEPVASAFEDEWFDPPIAAFSPAGGFQRVVPAASAAPAATPEPVPEPPRVRETAPPPVSRLPVEPEPAPVSRLPDPEPIPEPAVAAPAPILDDPVIDDSSFFLDDVIVGSFLPDVDLDA